MHHLEPPGAGLPRYEQILLNGFLKFGCWITSDESALLQFERESDHLLMMIKSNDLIEISEQVLIGRMMGMEDSSRNWSVLMVLEHLCMVNRDMLKVIESLQQGVEPRGELAIEFYKPDSDLDLGCADHFKDGVYDYLELVRALGKLDTKLTYRHPWFGPLNAHQWNVLAAVHMKVHRQQAQTIIAKIGVT